MAAAEYLANLSINVADLQLRLEDAEGTIFSNDEINVRITDIGDASVTSRIYDEGKSLRSVIDDPTPSMIRMRIISIYSERMVCPLQISSDLICAILQKYNVHSDFLRVLFSFGDEAHLVEAGSGNLAIRSPSLDETQISYQINYVEENHRHAQSPWSFRHTGIYHHHKPNFDFYILLHPNKCSVMETALFNILGIEPGPSFYGYQALNFCQKPYRLHLLLLSSYSGNWRWYFRYLGDQFAQGNNRALVIGSDYTNAQSSFLMVQTQMRNINDFALFAKACCMCELKVVDGIKSSATTPLKDASDLESQMMILREYIDSSGAFEIRIRNAIDWIGHTFTLHHHLETAKVDKELRDVTHQLLDVTEKMKDLTQDTVDDSATVKIITIVSAIYLPGSFAASIYGMNFFAFDSTSMSIVMGNDFWIFVATWLPLTGITIVIYIVTLWFIARRKGKPGRWLWTRGKPSISTGSVKQ